MTTEPDRPAERYAFRFTGSGAEYFFIFLKHLFLTLVTFGLYFAWAKTERRQFTWKSLSFHGHPFRYRGTAIELFKGYVLVLVAYFTLVTLPATVSLVSESLGSLLQTGLLLGIVAALPFVIYRSRNYLYSRTTWRNIRFGLVKQPGPYARQFFLGTLLSLLTLGLYVPVHTNRLHSILVNNTRFGSLEFHYDGDDGAVWTLAMKGLLLSFVTFGIYYFWYRAALERYRAAHTRLGDSAVLRSDVSGVQLLLLYVLNSFGLAVSFGLAFPWILMYSLGELADRYSVRGTIDFDTIVQRAEEEGAFAEGVADALDLDFGF